MLIHMQALTGNSAVELVTLIKTNNFLIIDMIPFYQMNPMLFVCRYDDLYQMGKLFFAFECDDSYQILALILLAQ